MSKATFDPTCYNTSTNTDFQTLLERRLGRRALIRRIGAIGGLAAMSDFVLTGCVKRTLEDPVGAQLGFESVAGSRTHAAVVPEGYHASVLAPWGAPLNDLAAEFKSDGTNTALDQANALGQHHDGLRYFPLNGSSKDGLLCINHEFLDLYLLHGGSLSVNELGLRDSSEQARKEIHAHGVTVVRITEQDGVWRTVDNDPHNRRITGASEIRLSGPVAGAATVTRFSPDGSITRGTLANCGNGYTPWGTYLTCEEHWPSYFINNSVETRSQAQNRHGIGSFSTRYSWQELATSDDQRDGEFARFDISPTAEAPELDYRNEAAGYGYVVELDPYNPFALPVKRTALGRFRHESCAPGVARAGEPIVFYSAHDGNFEYVYKYVSKALWQSEDADPVDRLAVGDKYMDDGTLYVARFNEDGTGTWLAFDPATPTLADPTNERPASTLGEEFADVAAMLLCAPLVADRVGGTPLDRPEWCAVDPRTGAVYLSLTGNSQRSEFAVEPQFRPNAANPREYNVNGHILRWQETADVSSFHWDVFVFGAPSDESLAVNLSALTDANQFAGPDGLSFDERGILWIQTDSSGSAVTADTNDQMLAVVPSGLRSKGDSAVIDDSNQANLRRFFVGPTGCEVTGFATTPDHTTVFCNVQHPGNWPFAEDATVETPAGMSITPRSATVAIRKFDGGKVGE